MKASILSAAITLLASMAVHAQDTATHVYQSVFGDSSTTWYIFVHSPDGVAGGTDRWTTTPSDTVSFGDTVYNKISRAESFGFFWGLYETPQYLRESDDRSKLYFKEVYVSQPWRQIKEVLLMDLYMGVGDTLDTSNWDALFDVESDFGTVPVIIVDSVFYCAGSKVLRTDFHYTDMWGTDTLFFIEGVGPTFGPFYPRHSTHHGLTCFEKDGEMEFHGFYYYFSFFGCEPGWCGKIETESAFNAEVFPNPAHDKINIRLPLPSSYQVDVYTLAGERLITTTSEGEESILDLSRYPNGVFLLVLSDGTTREMIKIVKI